MFVGSVIHNRKTHIRPRQTSVEAYISLSLAGIEPTPTNETANVVIALPTRNVYRMLTRYDYY